MPDARSPVVVMGVSGSGKSTVSAALARRLQVPFAEGDGFHPAANIAKMTAGIALDDADRYPWLERIAAWLAQRGDGGVISCSALKRRYRDQLRRHRPDIWFLHLSGSHRLIARRQTRRGSHFMPSSLLMSQFDALEPLGPDEHGITLGIGMGVDAIVDAYIATLARPVR